MEPQQPTEKQIAQENFMKQYTMGVKKPVDFVLGLTENKHGIDNPVTDLNTESLLIGGTAILVGLLTIDASTLTIPRTYTAQDADGIMTLQSVAFTAGRVPFAGSGGILTDDADLTFATDTLSATKVAMSSLTSTRVSYSSTAGLQVDSANLTFVSPALTIGVAGSATGQLKLTGATSGTVTVQTAAAAGTWTLTLPTVDGDANQFLQTNGSGVTTWAAPDLSTYVPYTGATADLDFGDHNISIGDSDGDGVSRYVGIKFPTTAALEGGFTAGSGTRGFEFLWQNEADPADSFAYFSTFGASNPVYFYGSDINFEPVTNLKFLGGEAAIYAILDRSLVTTSNKTFTLPNVTGTFEVRVATGRSTAQTAAVASVTTFTPAVDSSFEISANILVTTSTTHNFTTTCAYTDEGNTARTLTMSFTLVAGGALVTAVDNANGAVPYMGVPQRIRAKASTAITIATTGTFTTVTYNVEASIRQV